MSNLKSTILVIDDEKQIRKFLSITLSAAGYKVQEAENGAMGIRLAASIKPDVIICDLGLPDIDGTQVIEKLREWTETPLIVLSVRSESNDIVGALDLGADDYLVKPFDSEILLARIRANLRKNIKAETGSTVISVGDIEMDIMRHEVTKSGKIINLSPKEYKLLKYLMTHAGKMVMHSQLLHELWGKAHEDNIQYLRIYIAQIRQKLDAKENNLITTEPGIGYRLNNLAT